MFGAAVKLAVTPLAHVSVYQFKFGMITNQNRQLISSINGSSRFVDEWQFDEELEVGQDATTEHQPGRSPHYHQLCDSAGGTATSTLRIVVAAFWDLAGLFLYLWTTSL